MKTKSGVDFRGSKKQLTACLLVILFLIPSSLFAGNLDVSRNVYDSGRLDDVDKITGAFTYEIPIVTPPGRNGVEPKLSLQYYSQPQYETSIVGYGWGLSIPYIERINKQGSDTMYTTDTYFYSSLSGELASTTSTTYKAKVENGDFMTYEFAGNAFYGDAWIAKDKQGNVYKFGMTSGSLQNRQDTLGVVAKWMLEEVTDRNGNYITYEYYRNGGQIYPSKITYTHSSTTADGIFEVDFLRETRGDIASTSAAGFSVNTRDRIYEIDTMVNGSWVRKYALGYSNPTDRTRSLLTSITEYGRGDDGATTTRPAYEFTYQGSDSPGWVTDSSWDPPALLAEDTGVSLGTVIADINGDGRPDLLHSLYDADFSPTTTERTIYLNTGAAPGWVSTTTWKYPWGPYFTYNDDTEPFFPADLNADGYEDFIYNGTSTAQAYVYVNNHSGWATSSSWALPTSFENSNNIATVRLVDVNGDLLPDILKSESGGIVETYLNTGNGWATSTLWHSTYFVNGAVDQGVTFQDLNGDGLADQIHSYLNTVPNPDVVTYEVYLNNGSGWDDSTNWTNPDSRQISRDGQDMGFRFGEINGDGMPDIIEGRAGDGEAETYISNGTGWTDKSTTWNFPSAIVSPSGFDFGTRLLDLNADGLVDRLTSQAGIDVPGTSKTVQFNSSKKVDLLTHIKFPQGGYVNVEYKSSHAYKNGSTFLNTNLPYPIITVATTTQSDGLGNYATSTYSYEGGQLYWNSPHDRKFGSFSIVTKTDPDGNVSKTYFHQGSTTESTLGEYQDDVSKIGKPYRIEQYDSSGNLYNATINKWDKSDLGNGRNFVKLAEKLTLNYDGNSDHRDSLETYSYDATTGNPTQKIAWGQVTGSSDGTYTDSGSDKFITDLQYATSSTYNIYIPSHETVTNQSGDKVRESKFYYDSSSLGTVTKGNLTKQEMWKSGSIFIDTEKVYNGYGLVATDTDPRDKNTTYTYDSYNLYPATTTNPLSQAIGRQYDYSSGKVKILNDVNNRVSQTTYDGFDRVVEEKQPDQTTPSTLVTKSTYTYTDTGLPTKVQKTDSLSSATSTDFYTYFDGLGRKAEEKTEAEGWYATKDYDYDKKGLLKDESLPYFSSNTSYTATSSVATSTLFVRYAYDPLERVLTVANAVGTTTNAYDQWTASTTDAESNIKALTKDAYGNLVKVNEQNGSSIYTTSYEYDGNNKLTKITDADASVRNFTYDGLGRRLTAQDLHDIGDGTYGSWSFVYDDSGNVASSTDPKSQVIDYSYDDINRPLTENYTGAGGTEVTYAYDVCSNGKGRLCSATSTDAATQLAYNPLGLISSESKYLNSTYYTTSYLYDRLGNKTDITYPDSSQVKYSYNAAGQLESLATKPSGGSYANLVTNFDYAPTGSVSYKRFANCIQSTYTYDGAELYRLKNILTEHIIGCTGDSLMGGGGEELSLLRSIDSVPIYAGKMSRLFAQLDLTPADILSADATSTAVETTTPEFILPSVPEVQEIVESATTTPESATTTEPAVTTSESTATPEQATSTEPVVITEPSPGATSTSVLQLLVGKTAAEKAEIKSEAIVNAAPVKDPQDRGPYTITIDSITTIPGGVELFARVWKDGTQIGFGTDGSVDMERFRIINPPILVDDPNGPIVREYEDKGEIHTYNLREDPKEALLQVLEHNLSVMKNIHGPENIVTDKQGRTTSTFFPAAGENAPVDGSVARSGVDQIFTDIVAGNGTSFQDTDTLASAPELNSKVAHTNYFEGNRRAIWGFDTSSIPESDTITSATLSVVTSANDTSLGDFDYIITPASPASASALANSDYQNAFTRTNYGSKTLSTFATNNSTYNDITLSSGGKSYISKTGNTFFGGMHSWDFNQSYTGSYGGNQESRAQARFADETGTTKDPKLVVEHSGSVGSSGVGIQNITYTYDKVGNITNIVDNSTTGTGKALVFSYDDLNRLTLASTTAASSTPYKHTFALSSIGNITGMATSTGTGTTTYSYAETGYANPHAATSIGSATLTYDNDGNLSALGAKLYAWDYRNRLTQAGNGTASTTFAYDHTINRVKKVNSSITTYYPNDLYNFTAATSTKHIFDTSGALIATIEGNGTATSTYYQHADNLSGGNVSTDADGSVVETTDYYPYGDQRIATGTFEEQRKFIGEEYDTETNLSYLNARYYEGARGQFVSEDPVFWEIGQTQDGNSVLINPQAQNSYAYAGNNPLTIKDATGRFLETGFDIVMLGISIQQFRQDPSWTNAGGVLLDTVSLVIPGVPAVGGLTIRAAKIANEVDNVEDEIRLLPKIGEAGGNGAGKPFTKAVKDAAYEQSGGRCVFCNVQTSQRTPGPTQSNADHAIPRVQGGNNTIDNAQNTCRSCNLSKGANTTVQYLQKQLIKVLQEYIKKLGG